MDPITGGSLILTLIPFWQRERDKRTAASKEEFYSWLVGHNFKELKEYIERDVTLTAQIEEMLKGNHEELLNRFDAVDKQLLRILYSLDAFRPFIKYIAPSAVLSNNEEHILTEFVNSRENILYFRQTYEMGKILQAGQTLITGYDARFIDSNLQNLVDSGYLLSQQTTGKSLSYTLTEKACEYVQNLQGKDRLSAQAKSILVQYWQSKEPCLWTFLDEQGQVAGVQANNIELKFDEPNFIHDDLDCLAKAGFIIYDGDPGGGGRRYRLTRAGQAYAEKIAGKLERE